MPKIFFEEFTATGPIEITPQEIAFLKSLSKVLRFEDKGNMTCVTYIGNKS